MLARALRARQLTRLTRGALRQARLASSSAKPEQPYDQRLNLLAAGLVGVCFAQRFLDLVLGGERHEEAAQPPKKARTLTAPVPTKSSSPAASQPPGSVAETSVSRADAADVQSEGDTVAPRVSAVGPTVSTPDGRLTAFSDGQQLWLRNATSNLDCLLTPGAATVVGFTQPSESLPWLVYKAGGNVLAIQPEKPEPPLLLAPDLAGSVGQAMSWLVAAPQAII